MNSPPTSIDVARLAGVAQSTVSYVLTGKGRVSEETRQRVLRVAAELNYQPNAGAQALRSRKSKVLGLMFPVRNTGDQAGRMRFLAGIVAACRAQGYDALVVTADEGADGLRRLADTALCDGLLVMELKDEEPLTQATSDLRVPTVFVGVPKPHDSVICVARDYEVAGSLAAAKLMETGARHIVVLSPASSYASSLNMHQRFVRGIQRGTQAQGVRLSERTVSRSFLEIHRTVGEFVGDLRAPDGIITSPAVDTSAVIESLLLHGCTPGPDVSLVGLDDGLTLHDVPEGITVAHVMLNSTELAQQSVARLIQVIEDAPDKMVPGDVDLLEPMWVPGSTLVGPTD